jgi:hypothetical protein
MAATTGLPDASIAAQISCAVGASTMFGVLNSVISAPAQKARPSPVRTTAWIASSASAARSSS